LLPDFLRHYRSLGIDTFCFIDNGSVDGTRDYLLAQPDCLVYYTDELYKASGFAADWVNRVIAELRISGWFVLVDADEHLCYAHMERYMVLWWICIQQAASWTSMCSRVTG
jgi:hypothetical protein